MFQHPPTSLTMINVYHSKLGNELFKFGGAKGFVKKSPNCSCVEIGRSLTIPFLDFLSNQVTVYFQMLCSLMENWIGSNMNCTLTITVQNKLLAVIDFKSFRR